ncbi:hypothetical protein [Paludisphaera soli]|uniref:hypothetical protein n=1 Tax=Paludisphaera soli TaxID=2712865 RepID=UPI0013ED9C6D|nr:hypothetical protein [Paludisphaera soli]
MKGHASPRRVLPCGLILALFLVPMGCGSHPEEGTIDLPARKGEVADADAAAKKTSPSAKKRRATEADAAEGR